MNKHANSEELIIESSETQEMTIDDFEDDFDTQLVLTVDSSKFKESSPLSLPKRGSGIKKASEMTEEEFKANYLNYLND